MDRLRKLFSRRASYEPLEDVADSRDIDEGLSAGTVTPAEKFSWIDFIIFLILGNSMLWAWYISGTPWTPFLTC